MKNVPFTIHWFCGLMEADKSGATRSEQESVKERKGKNGYSECSYRRNLRIK